MSSDIFDLDEEREEAQRTEQSIDASSRTAQAGPSQAAGPSTVPLRVTTNSNLLSPLPQPFAPALPQHRKHGGSFAATPSFPSPLAQAITVPPHSDTSSSSSHSDESGSEDGEQDSTKGNSETRSKGKETPRKGFELRPRTSSPKGRDTTPSPSSTEKSVSRPTSPARLQAVGPSSLLTKTRTNLPPITTASPSGSPRTSPTSRKSSPTHTRRLTDVSKDYAPPARRRSGSHSSSLNVPMSTSSQAGSSPLAFGSPELDPIDDEIQARSSRGSTSSPQDTSRDSPNILGLGLGGNWETTSTASGSSRSGSVKGRSKDGAPPSPRRDRMSIGGMPILSPPRQRRPSEFLNPSSLDTRKMPVMGGRNNGVVSTLSSSASMISPLNPLPSPWASGSEGSSAFSPASVASESSATTPSSGGGAIRLNRVPTSVRLAAELIKQPSASTSPPPQASGLHNTTPSSSSGSAAATGAATPNATPQDPGQATFGREGSARDLAAMPPPTLPHAKPPFNIGKGRPTLSVPATPASTRNSSYADKAVDHASGLPIPLRKTSSSSLAPPTSFKAPIGQVPKARPSAPPQTESNPGKESFAAQTKTHRYRTSMHEASFKSGFAKTAGTTWANPETPATARTIADPQSGLGLGLDMPQTAVRLTHGEATDNAAGAPRQRSVTGQGTGYALDLAGVGSLGDAATHASMIMQSRQAKLQRWRPTSSGMPTGSEQKPVPPAFNRSTTTGSPAMLSAPRDIRQAQWGYQSKGGLASAASSPGEDLPPVPMTLSYDPATEGLEERRLATSHTSSRRDQHPATGLSGFVPSGGEAMTRMGSATAQIAGVEWVDWMDEYKRYKEAKIRADNEAATLKAQAEMPPPPLPNQDLVTDSPKDRQSARSSPVARETARKSPRADITATLNDTSSAVDLTPSVSRDEIEGHLHSRRRSMSIRSQLSLLDPTRSPNQRKLSVFERPRQTSNGSNKSDATSSQAGHKKKKNLVNKMEGWWNAVKSNFSPESGSAPHQVHRPSNLGVYAERRIPSAPASRRSSGKSAIAEPEPPAPAMLRRDTSHSLRNATSVAELRSPVSGTGPPMLADAANITASTSGDILTLPRPSSMLTVPSGMSAYSTSRSSPTASVRVHSDTLPVPMPGLEARRRQPGLRLELEPHVLTQLPPRSRGHSSNGSVSALPAHLSTVASSASGSHRPSESTSRSSSYGNASAGPGLTPGVQPWEQTPSPIFAVTTANSGNGASNANAGTENTVASVRRHVKHRLNGAKGTCDNTLHKVIAAITLFADETRAQDEALMDEKRRMEEQRDYFENISDSPLIDGDESDAEGSLAMDGSRSRNVSSSRGPSRRPSISRPSIASSPTRRTSILPSSPNRPTRRRPSAQPRNYVGRDRLNRSAGLALDRTRSGTSSRSTSRSHSPMPMFPRTLPNTAGDEEDDVEADRQFLASLQELIVIATDVLESSVNSLLSRPSACTEIIQKLQRVGQNWDEHDDWPGRNWYVEILMAIAGLRRVLDWWEAEKGFWAFDDEDENEPLLFVLKPKEESKFDQEFKAHYDRSISPIRPILARPASTQDTLDVPSGDADSALSTGRTAHPDSVDTPVAKGVDDLKFLAEHAKMVNIVMELGLQGEEIQYVNDAIMEVTGQDPDGVLGLAINELLAPADANSFAEATQRLLEDDNNTVQMRVRIEVQDLDNDTKGEHQPGPVYVEVEGVGMLMRENNEPSHTMWVLKPVTATQRDTESTAPPDAAFPVERIMSNESILCRICERDIVSWFFEKHNETCDAVHRLEAEVSDCNECLHDLCHTFSKLKGELEKLDNADQSSQSGVLFYEIPDCLADNSTAPPGAQGVEIRRIVPAQLEAAIEVLKAAEQIETPIVREDEADLEFNVQRYLGRDSEEHLNTVSRWQRPTDIDRSLVMLYNHVEAQLRRKHKAIARMQSTIRYSEKTRHEWEDKVNRLLEELSDADQSGSGSGSGSDEPEITPPVADTSLAPDNSPPNQRKIAPQARIPITQGHPQRPSTAHGASPFGQSQSAKKSNRPTTSHGSTLAPRPKVESAPSSASLVAPPRPEQPKRSRSSNSKPDSPLLVPADRMSHARRVSTSRGLMTAPLSPRIPSAAAQPRANPPSIKDFEIIKPISRGAFGSVYLAKKVATGDYFAIKALKKSDMIAKNQITNVKAERTILMNQSSSPYVTKLFFSFQSKDYLYLVMEYLNGGDCASLVKTLGGLPEEWARNYIAEVVLGLEYLHDRNIVHRDIKPDNLLIDARGHLKLTDFGLSKIGLLNRQVGGPRPAYLRGTSLRASRRPQPPARGMSQRSPSSSTNNSPMMSPDLMPPPPGPSSLGQSYFGHHDSADESSGSESVAGVTDLMRQMSVANKGTSDVGTPSVTGDGTAGVPRFVGTPDYLAPESILGIGTEDRMVDWWALGVVLYEFLYGFPPFHAETPEKVFDNVVSRRIDWHEDEIELSAEARDLMDRLMCYDANQRLGSRGAGEVRQHAFFAGIDWSTVATAEASFVPEVTDPESTDYFDARGAMNAFQDDDTAPQVLKQKKSAAGEMSAVIDDIAAQDDFGAFEFRNLPVLKQANDDVIRKLRTESMTTMSQALEQGVNMRDRGRSASASAKARKPSGRKLSDLTMPSSPATSASSLASTPSRPTTPSTASASAPATQQQHGRRPSELKAFDRLKSDDADLARRNSAPSRVRNGSEGRALSGSGPSPSMELWRQRRQASMNTEIVTTSTREEGTSTDSAIASQSDSESAPPRRGSDRALDVLIAEDNPISQKILETLLTRMGCRCICVEDGPQALASTMGSIRFDVIICDIHMPVVSGEQVARMIRSTNNHNQNTPIIAATSYEQSDFITEEGTLFSAILNKPVTKAALVKTLSKLGFELSASGGDEATTTKDPKTDAAPQAPGSNSNTVPASAV